MPINILDTIEIEKDSKNENNDKIIKKIPTSKPVDIKIADEDIQKKENPAKKQITKKVIKPTSKKRKKEDENDYYDFRPLNPIWLSISEAAKVGGVQQKTIRRAIQSNKIRYKIYKNRYLLDFTSTLNYLNSNKKLQNKLLDYGIGQYIEEWRK